MTKKKSVEDMFAELSAQNSLLAGVPASSARLESLVLDLKNENQSLRADLAERDKDILALKNHVNSMDQYNRSWSVRIFNLPIPEPDANNNFKVAAYAYDRVLLPILLGAVAEGDISDVPSCMQLLERAHVLPSKGDKTASVICRFMNRDYRALVFKHKRKYQPRDTNQPPTSRRAKNAPASPPGRYLFPIYEDLTRPTMNKLRALSAHNSVVSAWTTHGVIKYKLKDDSAIYRVANVYDSVEKILSG